MQREINELINTTQDITEGTNFIGRQLLGLQASNNPSINAPIPDWVYDGENNASTLKIWHWAWCWYRD